MATIAWATMVVGMDQVLALLVMSTTHLISPSPVLASCLSHLRRPGL